MKKLLLIAALIFMVGCAHVETQVTTGNDITTSIVGATYEIIPLDEQRNAPQVVTYGFSGELLKTAIAVATNNDTNNVSQISLNIDR